MKELRRELCRLILGKIGFVPPPNFGKVGISTKEFLLDKSVKLQIEDELGNSTIEKFGLWAGELSFQGANVRVLATDICNIKTGYDEFIMIYKTEKASLNAIRAVYGMEDFGLFLVKHKDKWQQVGVANMLMSAAGFEQMANMGLTWKPSDDYEDLLKAIHEIIDMV